MKLMGTVASSRASSLARWHVFVCMSHQADIHVVSKMEMRINVNLNYIISNLALVLAVVGVLLETHMDTEAKC
jgi:hypothetical protein